MRRRYYRKYKHYNKPPSKFLLYFIGFSVCYVYPSVIIPVLLVLIFIWFLKNRKNSKEHETEPSREVGGAPNQINLPYERKISHVTEAEKNFNKVLTDAVGGRFDIQRQVLLTTLVDVTSQDSVIYGTGRKFNPDRSRIDRLTIDFVLFNKGDLSPYLAIELDDRSHEREDRIKRDELVQEVLAGTGVRLVRVKNAYSYNPETLDMILNL